MDLLLSRVTQQAINYAIRSGVAVTGGYAIRQCGRLLQSAPKGSARKELQELQFRLESKIRVCDVISSGRAKLNNVYQIISPAIDMIELM